MQNHKDYEQLFAKLCYYKQDHLIQAYKNLDCQYRKQKFLEQIKNIDYELMQKLNQIYQKKQQQIGSDQNFQLNKLNNMLRQENISEQQRQNLKEKGYESLIKGELGIVMMAAGQGSRLGFEHAKGIYDIQLQSKKSIFRIISERLVGLQKLIERNYNKQIKIPFLIMTSPMNKEETIQFFKQNKYFGLDNNQVSFFVQGVLPALDQQGKVILLSESEVFMAPNGNGSIYQSLLEEKMVEELEGKKIKYIQIIGIDNVLVKIGDPLFLGMMINEQYTIAAKFIDKKDENEQIGVHCLRDGKVQVLEYTEITQQQAKMRDDTGRLIFSAANIVNIIMRLDFIHHIYQHKQQLNTYYHIAKKNIHSYDVKTNQYIDQPSIKFELFLFDVYSLLQSAQQFGLLEAIREQEFAPVKNKEGSPNDSPNVARQMMSKLHQSWLVKQGFTIMNPEQLCEISGLISYEGEGLDKFTSQLPKVIKLPLLLE